MTDPAAGSSVSWLVGPQAAPDLGTVVAFGTYKGPGGPPDPGPVG